MHQDETQQQSTRVLVRRTRARANARSHERRACVRPAGRHRRGPKRWRGLPGHYRTVLSPCAAACCARGAADCPAGSLTGRRYCHTIALNRGEESAPLNNRSLYSSAIAKDIPATTWSPAGIPGSCFTRRWLSRSRGNKVQKQKTAPLRAGPAPARQGRPVPGYICAKIQSRHFVAA